jgi:pimeloyl-ACP methyl ester carboxylesterase
VADAEWALDRILDRHGDVPVTLIGHSMGGRTAVAVAGHPNVVALAALAPWLPAGEPYEQVAGRAVLVVHGRLDTTTSPRGSLEWARRAAAVTDRIWRVELRWERRGDGAGRWVLGPWKDMRSWALAAVDPATRAVEREIASSHRQSRARCATWCSPGFTR